MPYILIVLFVVFAILIMLLNYEFDIKRIERHLRSHGATLLDIKWIPFSRDILGTKERNYRIHFIDREENTHESFCNTSFLEVYFTKDTIIIFSDSSSDPK